MGGPASPRGAGMEVGPTEPSLCAPPLLRTPICSPKDAPSSPPCPLPSSMIAKLCLEPRGFTRSFFVLSLKSWGNSRPPTRPGSGWERCHPSLRCAASSQKSTMESKDEVSDSDSGIILQSGEWLRKARHSESPGAPPGLARLRCWRTGAGWKAGQGLCWGQTWGGPESFPSWRFDRIWNRHLQLRPQ